MTALTVAVLLAVALIYTSFSASTEAKVPSELLDAPEGTTAQMTGTVVPHSIERIGNGIAFRVSDRAESGNRTVSLRTGRSLRVTYEGTVPDPFRTGREIILTGTMKNRVFVGEPETLTTKCPSKFSTEGNS